MDRRRVAILVFPGFQSLDAVGPFEVFAAANRFADESAAQKAEERTKPRGRGPWRYDPKLVSLDGGAVEAPSGLTYTTEPLGKPAGVDTLIIAGGGGVDAARQNPALLDWIKDVAGSAERVATVCTGTFLAASAGLLEGRRVTTHWSRADELAEEFPGTQVDADPIYSYDLVAVEDLDVRNMVRSASGTIEAPGTNVAQKRGLNRSIHAQGWSMLRRRIEDKAATCNVQVIAVDPAHTSQRCSACGHTAAENRKNQAVFACQACGHTDNADVNAANNILAAGLAVTARRGTSPRGPSEARTNQRAAA